jgi:mannose-1-phosphate guanylyltransferase/mannose-1-phosphate guanylyltransferase/mannose-6-phosphate isomerase
MVPVILSGGAGTRLWPLSTPEWPKQLHVLAGDKTMLQMTAERVSDGSRFNAPIVVTNVEHLEAVSTQLDAIGVQPALTILEPFGRNTAAAIALAALEAEPDALLLVMPSDHVIGRPDKFVEAIEIAQQHARQGFLVTFGITPDRPETGYGYIKSGGALGQSAWTVERFVEKPSAERAAAYLMEGGYAWNGGIFLFQASDLLEGLQLHAPDILEGAGLSLARARREPGLVFPEGETFGSIRSESIDYALLESHGRVAVVPVDMDWSDLGSWDAVHELAPKDLAANSLVGSALAIDTQDCLLLSSGPRLVTVGCHDLIVIATPDAVLVLPKGESQRVREAVEMLRSEQSPPQSAVRPPTHAQPEWT